MIEFDDVQDLVSPVVIAAFEGWNDAADAASGLVDHLMEQWKAEVIGAIDPEEFYDFQVNRPIIGTDVNGHRRLTWPTTRIAVVFPAPAGAMPSCTTRPEQQNARTNPCWPAFSCRPAWRLRSSASRTAAWSRRRPVRSRPAATIRSSASRIWVVV